MRDHYKIREPLTKDDRRISRVFRLTKQYGRKRGAEARFGALALRAHAMFSGVSVAHHGPKKRARWAVRRPLSPTP